MELRPYQQEAKKAIFEEWEKGNRRTLLVLPTGTGKTIVQEHIWKKAPTSKITITKQYRPTGREGDASCN